MTSSCKFRNLTAPALHCNIGGPWYMLTTCLGLQIFFYIRIDTRAAMFKRLVFSILLRNVAHGGQLQICALTNPRAAAKEPRASETNDVCVNLITYITKSVGSACTQYIARQNTNAHPCGSPEIEPLHPTKKAQKRMPARNDRPQAG